MTREEVKQNESKADLSFKHVSGVSDANLRYYIEREVD